MLDLKELFVGNSNDEIIRRLKHKSVEVADWSNVRKDYEPKLHAIVKDQHTRKDRVRTDGVVENASRLYIGLEKLLSKRVNEYTFSIPVRREYSNIGDSEVRKEIANAIESIYKNAKINTVNLKRGLAYYVACEIFTIWYAVKKKNTLYGFNSQYKLKCKTYSPKDGVRLYPLIDNMDDMLAMSFEYDKDVDGQSHTYFETFTEDRHYLWEKTGVGEWRNILTETDDDGIENAGETIKLGKIPGAYLFRKNPIFEDLSELRNELEYTLSRNSDVLAYNSAPVLKVVGDIVGDETKGESHRLFRLKNGGDVDYVSWTQSIEAIKFHCEILVRLFFMQAQMPDISFENLKGLGSIGYDARQTMFTDAYLKIQDEAGPWIEFLERECNVIKAFLKLLNTKWKDEIDQVEVKHIITPYIQNDEMFVLEKWLKANGEKPLVGHRESIRKAGLSDDPEATYKELEKENNQTIEEKTMNLFGGSAAI